jgi:hypothetical protein
MTDQAYIQLHQDLIWTCQSAGAGLKGITHEGEPVPGGSILLIIAGLESNFGQQRLYARLEAGYAKGGYYYQKSPEVQQLWTVYGCMAACSYGTFQIMFVTARELGFLGHPVDLQSDEVGAFWAAQLIARRIIKAQGASTLAQVLDGYNSGSSRDANVPEAYINKGVSLYKSLKLTR